MTLFECSEPDSAGASSDPGRPVCRQPPSAAGAPQPLLTLPHPGACTKHRRTRAHECTHAHKRSHVLVSLCVSWELRTLGKEISAETGSCYKILIRLMKIW